VELAVLETCLPKVTLEGVLKARKRVGRSAYVAYFAVLADGVLLKNLGEQVSDGKTLEVSFTRSLVILGKSGPSGLEGSVSNGGAWLAVSMVPSAEERSLELRLPLRDERVSLRVKGFFDVSLVRICPSCEHRELLELHPQRRSPPPGEPT
jgi:hypothetical protein